MNMSTKAQYKLAYQFYRVCNGDSWKVESLLKAFNLGGNFHEIGYQARNSYLMSKHADQTSKVKTAIKATIRSYPGAKLNKQHFARVAKQAYRIDSVFYPERLFFAPSLAQKKAALDAKIRVFGLI